MSTRPGSAEEQLRGLSDDRAALLKRLLEKRSARPPQAGSGKGPVAHLVARADEAPCSWSQQRLWLIDQVEQGSPAYHIAQAIRIRGTLNESALKSALDSIVGRHMVLRTVIVLHEGAPVQRIAGEPSFHLKRVDLSGLTAAERETELRRQKVEEASTAFKLDCGPLIRGRLLCLSPDEHLLLITMHHIISDGWSLGVFFRELAELYTSSPDSSGPQLPTLPMQYADFARWQQQWLQGDIFDRQLSYWRATLEGAPPLLELPTDRPRPPTQSYSGGNVELRLDPQLTAALRALAQRRGVTLFMALYAGWATLLARLSGQTDIVIGTPIANRQRPELEGLIGFFANTLVLRVQADPELSVAEFLGRVRDVARGAFDHQDMPFEKIVDVLHPQRSLSRNPLFQVMLALHRSPQQPLRLPGLDVAMEDSGHNSSMFDLLLSLEARDTDITGVLNFATDLFDRDTVDRWLECLIVLLHAMTENEQTTLGQLPILPEDQRNQVLLGFNDTQAEYPADQLLHELFEQQVERTPTQTALVSETGCLSYADLNRKANQLARYLRYRGVGPDRRVGLCVERSAEMVIGLLGILKAGGAYVPLDPTYPSERLAYLLEDAAPTLLLTQERLRAGLPRTSADVLSLDADWPEIETFASTNLTADLTGVRPDHLAYVIYTSGSTGKPKGAMNEHRGVVNRLHWMQQNYQLTAQDRILQKTPFSFDVSVWEFFWTLLNGATLVIARPHGHLDPSYLTRLIETTGVTRLHFVPSMLQVFLDHHRPGSCPTLQHVVCSGEELPAALVRRCFECFPHVRLSNLYGPTEAAVDVTAWECTPDDAAHRIPIGRPFSNIRMYVLDAYRQPVPVGVTGEIYISGIGVGRGYLMRPELTPERFLQDPFNPGSRMYRTGDLGRWRADGAIEYLGRNDFQVKINGLRIELGEIETQLRQDGRLKEAVVLVREDVRGVRRLVAYMTLSCTAEEGANVVEDLRSRLRTALPEYMIPSAFLVLEQFPLTPNGKLDRSRLPTPESTVSTAAPREPPEGELENAIATVWRKMLCTDQVGRDDNFFELGGNSLHGIKLIMSIAEQLQVNLPVVTMFQAPTIRQMAAAVERLKQPSATPAVTQEMEFDEGTL